VQPADELVAHIQIPKPPTLAIAVQSVVPARAVSGATQSALQSQSKAIAGTIRNASAAKEQSGVDGAICVLHPGFDPSELRGPHHVLPSAPQTPSAYPDDCGPGVGVRISMF
jgi:hypothetical protein